VLSHLPYWERHQAEWCRRSGLSTFEDTGYRQPSAGLGEGELRFSGSRGKVHLSILLGGGIVEFSIRYDIRAPAFSCPQADLFSAYLVQYEWADRLGFQFVNLHEHNGSDDGYNPSPFVLAAAIAARTKRIKIRLAALILPLHDPIRLVEDAAVVDQISRGRLELVVGAGYRSREFTMFGKDISERIPLQI
jgi:hypothetical protein